MNSSENGQFHNVLPWSHSDQRQPVEEHRHSTFLSLLEVLLDSTANHRGVRTARDACGFLSSTGTSPESFWEREGL